jgi:hypothetical protein
VLVSSHQLAEMALTVDDVVIVSGGRLVLQSSLSGRVDLEALYLDLTRQEALR